MSRLLLLAFLLIQGPPQRTGVVTGVVRAANGTPSPRVRVYAITYKDAVEAAKAPPALESQAETDLTGRYRLELPPGRFYIASGSLNSPTYFPGTTDMNAARVVSVAADTTVPDINFGSFVPATPNRGGIPFAVLPTGNGVFTGTLRYPDGKPASGITVIAVPASVLPLTSPSPITTTTLTPPGVPALSALTVQLGNLQAQVQATLYTTLTRQYLMTGNTPPVTDATGAFKLDRLAADSYYILAGYADAPTFYPGAPDLANAKTVTSNATSTVNGLDFRMPELPQRVSVSGKVLTSDGGPASGAAVRIRPRTTSQFQSVAGLPALNGPRQTIVGADGSFSVADIVPGNFIIDVSVPGVTTQSDDLVVLKDGPNNNLRFVIPIALLSGKILMEDGSPVPDPKVFGDALITTVNNPNMIASTIFPISSSGTFTRLIEGNEFRFYLRMLPEEYEIRSMKFGNVDLTKENLRVTGKETVNIEIRIAKRSTTATPPNVRFAGTVTDVGSALPTVADRVTLCCNSTGPVERFSAPLKDGKFEFSGIPPGRYTPGLQPKPGSPQPNVVNAIVDVGSSGSTDASILTTQQFGQVMATPVMADGSPVPDSVRVSVAFVGLNGKIRVPGERNIAGAYIALVPLGGRYEAVVENVSDAYRVQIIRGDMEPASSTAQVALFGRPGGLVPIQIVLEKK
jgi:hypothetical protein